jgi:hypothetical protein
MVLPDLLHRHFVQRHYREILKTYSDSSLLGDSKTEKALSGANKLLFKAPRNYPEVSASFCHWKASSELFLPFHWMIIDSGYVFRAKAGITTTATTLSRGFWIILQKFSLLSLNLRTSQKV